MTRSESCSDRTGDRLTGRLMMGPAGRVLALQHLQKYSPLTNALINRVVVYTAGGGAHRCCRISGTLENELTCLFQGSLQPPFTLPLLQPPVFVGVITEYAHNIVELLQRSRFRTYAFCVFQCEVQELIGRKRLCTIYRFLPVYEVM